jgi:hypothetical protein
VTGLDREIARRRRHAAKRPVEPAPIQPERCSAGNDPERCCVGDPWANINPYYDDPLPSAVIQIAARHGVEPHILDHHVEGVHGWEPHDVGYDTAVEAAAACLLAGGCEGAVGPT